MARLTKPASKRHPISGENSSAFHRSKPIPSQPSLMVRPVFFWSARAQTFLLNLLHVEPCISWTSNENYCRLFDSLCKTIAGSGHLFSSFRSSKTSAIPWKLNSPFSCCSFSEPKTTASTLLRKYVLHRMLTLCRHASFCVLDIKTLKFLAN